MTDPISTADARAYADAADRAHEDSAYATGLIARVHDLADEVDRLRAGRDAAALALGRVLPWWNARHGDGYAGICEQCYALDCASLFGLDDGRDVCEACYSADGLLATDAEAPSR